MPNRRKKRARHQDEVARLPAERSSQTSFDPPKVDLSYAKPGTAEDYIDRVLRLLNDEQTSLYVDTSIAMWISAASPQTIQLFFDWLDGIKAHVYVPVWTYHEYYRHFHRRTLRGGILKSAAKLRTAAKNFKASALNLSDHSLMPGQTAAAYVREIEGLEKTISTVTKLPEAWDDRDPAQQMSEWLLAKVCRSRTVFDLMDSLANKGASRYTQDVPPGFMDRPKKDKKRQGSNKYGDLIFWEEVLAHVPMTKARNVILLTKDRKEDWYVGSEAQTPDDKQLRSLRSPWQAVPIPHPLLTLELSEKTGARELVLLDDLYTAGVLWSYDKEKYKRLIAYAVSLSASALDDRIHAATQVPAAAAHAAPLAPPTAAHALQASKAAVEPTTELALRMLAQMNESSLRAQELIASIDQERLKNLSPKDLATFAREIADQSLLPSAGSPLAQLMVDKLFEVASQCDGRTVAAIYAGLTASAYKTGTAFKPAPKAVDIQRLFSHLMRPELEKLRKYMSEGFLSGSKAFFIPGRSDGAITVTFTASTSQIPLVLRQITINERVALTDIGPSMPSNLRQILKKDEASLGALADATAEWFGLPRALMKFDTALDEIREIPRGIGYLAPDLTADRQGDALVVDESVLVPDDLQEVIDEHEEERQFIGDDDE